MFGLKSHYGNIISGNFARDVARFVQKLLSEENVETSLS